MVKDNFPHFTLVINNSNLGAAEGKNIGIRKAMESPITYIYMLDNDMIADRRSLSELVQVAESDPQAGLVGTKIFIYGKPDVLLSAGGKINFTQNIGGGRNYHRKDKGRYNVVEQVDYVWGGALLIRRSVIETVGYYDPMFKGYWFEDTDFSLRVRKAGYKVLYCPHAHVWHQPHETSEQYSYRKKYLASRNAIYFMKKHAVWHNWLKYLFIITASLPFAFLHEFLIRKSISGTSGKATGIIDGLCNRPHRVSV